MLDNFATGHRGQPAALRPMLELVEGDIQSYERAHNAVQRLRGRLPPGRAAVRAALGPGPADQQRGERDRHAQRAARRPRQRRAARRLRLVLVGLRREPRRCPSARTLPAVPISPYAVAKLAGEGYCRSFSQVYGLETVALRYFNVFGPRQDPLSQYAAVIPNFITACLDGQRADDLRRRRAVARLHLRRQRRATRTCCAEARPRRSRVGLQHRLREAGSRSTISSRRSGG